jgi:hypothetical protein
MTANPESATEQKVRRISLCSRAPFHTFGSNSWALITDLRPSAPVLPHRAPTVQQVADTTAVTASADSYPDQQQLDAERFAAGQEQTTRGIDQTVTSIAQAPPAKTSGITAR